MNYRFDKIAFNSTAKKTPTESDKEHYIGLEHIDSECLEITRWGSDVAPIGEKWWERIHNDPSVDLYFKDRRHASPAGSKLAAQVIFDTIKEKID